MNTPSRTVTSNQSGLHPRLEEVVRRHLDSPWRQPVADHTREAFERVASMWDGRPLVFDSGCGTGESTARLARRHPDSLVIGIDRSQHRLARRPSSDRPANQVCVRAELADFWRLAVEAGWELADHYLLYPNPWPKAVHLMRRWYGHPVLPALLALGGRIEVRTNWRLYLEEFRRALDLAGVSAVTLEPVGDDEPLTPFERKYRAGGQALWALHARLAPRTSTRP